MTWTPGRAQIEAAPRSRKLQNVAGALAAGQGWITEAKRKYQTAQALADVDAVTAYVTAYDAADTPADREPHDTTRRKRIVRRPVGAAWVGRGQGLAGSAVAAGSAVGALGGGPTSVASGPSTAAGPAVATAGTTVGPAVTAVATVAASAPDAAGEVGDALETTGPAVAASTTAATGATGDGGRTGHAGGPDAT